MLPRTNPFRVDAEENSARHTVASLTGFEPVLPP